MKAIVTISAFVLISLGNGHAQQTALPVPKDPCPGQKPPGNISGFLPVQVEDVFKVMEIVTDTYNSSLWPNFKTSEIPVLVFDSLNTWLFHYPGKPDGFDEVKNHPGVYCFKGQHALVRGNTITRMGDTWVATSIFTRYSQRTGERYKSKDLAGIIIHEQFHIYSRTKHPRWIANDGLLLRYPAETPDALFLRRIEKEAFKRAVTADKPEVIRGWVKEGLKYRFQRMNSLPPAFRLYEPELQRTEGLSDYIEKTARGLDPLNASQITNGIAPAGVRDLGYVEGRWIAMILDKIHPGWKSVLEDNDAQYLEDILKAALNELPFEPKQFSPTELDSIRNEANADFAAWNAKKGKEYELFLAKPGYRIEIAASNHPLSIRIFEPLEIEIQTNGAVFHRVIFSAANELGSVRVRDLPCITDFNNSLGVTGIQIHGLMQKPRINRENNTIELTEGPSTLQFKFTTISHQDSLYRIEL